MSSSTLMERVFDPTKLLDADLKAAAGLMTQKEVKFLVDFYYAIQTFRKASKSQIDELEKSQEPHIVMKWMFGNVKRFESNIKKAMEIFSSQSLTGRWAKQHVGIGPVIAAGLLAHIDIHKAVTAGKLWRFAGLDQTTKWWGREKGTALVDEVIKAQGEEDDVNDDTVAMVAQKMNRKPDLFLNLVLKLGEGVVSETALKKAASMRPYNADLQVLCWNIGESFVHVSGDPNAFYGQLYRGRKVQEVAWNEAGKNKEYSANKLLTTKIGKSTDAYKAYSSGKLPPAHVHARAKRWTVKIFLAHFQAVMFEEEFHRPAPSPFVEEHMGHTDIIRVPGWPLRESSV